MHINHWNQQPYPHPLLSNIISSVSPPPLCHVERSETSPATALRGLNYYHFLSMLGYFLVLVGLKRIPATTVSIYTNLQPVVASTVTILIGQDVLSWEKPVATILVITGVIIVTKVKGGSKTAILG